MLPTSKIKDTPKQWKELYLSMEGKLADIEQGTFDLITRIRLCITACKFSVDSLKTQISSYVFQSMEEEVYFFKEVKPAFYSHLIYYLKLFNLETGRPIENSRLWEANLNRVLERIQYYFDSNIEFYQYYRSGDSYLDDRYFMRGNESSYLKLDDYYFSFDTAFSTSHDLKVAKIQANERLYLYVSKCLLLIHSSGEINPNTSQTPSLNWTATKAGLIELLYALQSTGVFNNGTSDLKQLAEYFEKTFHVELGNYYNVFQEIRIRKKNRTTFLDQLKERLTKRMDEADENGR